MADIRLNPYPFGNPDGAWVQIHDMTQYFIDFDELNGTGGITWDIGSHQPRLIIGRKGTGKTIYLRRLQAAAMEDGALYVDKITRGGLSTHAVNKFCELFNPSELSGIWSKLWFCAVVCSIVSHMKHVIRLREKVSEEMLEHIDSTFARVLLSTVAPLNPYQAASQIIHQYSARNAMDRYLGNELWAQLEWYLGQNLPNLPPLYFFLDAVDEEFAESPMHWLHVQKGLFSRIRRFMMNQEIGGRLHIFACIRDVVFSSILQGEAVAVYMNNPHIRVLKWDKSSVRYFLEEKLRRLSGDYLMSGSGGSKSCAAWLGIDTIADSTIEPEQPIADYLLRHSRLLPRDIVILGNELAEEVKRAKGAGHSAVSRDAIVQRVADRAQFFAREQLMICSNQVASSMIPANAIQNGADAFYRDPAYPAFIADQLRSLLQSLEYDRVTLDNIITARGIINDEIGVGGIDVMSVLWQNGLLGYVPTDRNGAEPNFYTEDDLLQFVLPEHRDYEYVIHPCLAKYLHLKHSRHQ